MRREAVIDGEYRYSLIREWDESNAQRVVFVLLNPSTADDEGDDQTTKVCIEFAKKWGYGSLQIVNLFAFRATYPTDLKKVKDYKKMVGVHNHSFLQNALQNADKIVVAWGEHGKIQKRYMDDSLKSLFSYFPLYCFREIANNQPKHPLGVDYNTPLVEYTFFKQFRRPALDEGVVEFSDIDEEMGNSEKNNFVS
ncbi:DUF1643 domain-containing protein [Peribacillus huizhouensis]|uniref:DUF1643 domain-containing protein n=1 Tax=Peribacillus huizhouensis TaxID=1501239 RepID=A0ABR6CSH5_9BACI|nr:DUF1643 domain-containing protein [Peribacillus huizhouensis]MBA9027613.1 hypothetical protein [Peribacillus huizhouensis]